MRAAVLLLGCAGVLFAAPADDDFVFRSDVSLVRVDAQVVDGSNRAITRLNAEDFVVREDGQPVAIKNLVSEQMPMDILFLLDVSASMRPHVQRIADASDSALGVLGKDDRMAIMVFDRATRIRLAFSTDRRQVRSEFDRLLRDERFNGGTDITRAMLDAADYIRNRGRHDARKAIVILTDDRTEFDRDDRAVGRALSRADAVLCALIAPDAMQNRGGYPGGGQRRGGYGGGGIGGGGPLGGIILPRGGGGPYGGGRPGGGGRGGAPRTQSAGTSEIARDSGGDSMSVNDSSALEETLLGLRQRYSIFFSLPDGVKPGDERNIQVDLASAARRRNSDAEIRYRRVYMTADGGSDPAPVRVTRAPGGRDDFGSSSSNGASSSRNSSAPSYSDAPQSSPRRRTAVNQDGTPVSGPDQDH
jgi:VWFA-related protein